MERKGEMLEASEYVCVIVQACEWCVCTNACVEVGIVFMGLCVCAACGVLQCTHVRCVVHLRCWEAIVVCRCVCSNNKGKCE